MGAGSNQVSLAAVLAAMLALVTGAATAGPAVGLAPHRAIYDLSLESRDSNSSIVTVRGRMVHEITGAACEGYSVSMRWVAEMGDSKGDIDIDDIRFASHEDGAGAVYDFTSVRRLNEVVIEEVRAHAERGEGSGAGRVQLLKPSQGEIALPAGTLFPSAHLRTIIAAAMAGERIVEKSVYDVSEDGRKIYQTLAVVGARQAGDDAAVIAAEPARKALRDLGLWRATVSYFEGSGAADETPAFAQSFDLYENGVAARLTLDYGELVIGGRLTDLEFLSAPDCAGAPGPG